MLTARRGLGSTTPMIGCMSSSFPILIQVGGFGYCINYAYLRFIDRDDIEAASYGDYLDQVEDK